MSWSNHNSFEIEWSNIIENFVSKSKFIDSFKSKKKNWWIKKVGNLSFFMIFYQIIWCYSQYKSSVIINFYKKWTHFIFVVQNLNLWKLKWMNLNKEAFQKNIRRELTYFSLLINQQLQDHKRWVQK